MLDWKLSSCQEQTNDLTEKVRMFTVIQSDPMPGSSPPLPTSRAIRAGDYVFLSAQFSADEAGQIVNADIETETRLTLKNVERVLQQAELDLSSIVQVRCYLADRNDVAVFNQVYQQFFTAPYPVRTMLAGCLPCEGKVAVDVVAYAGK